MKLSERQHRPLRKQNEGSVKAPNDVDLPNWVEHELALGSKHPVRDKLNETHFLADFNIFLSDLKKSQGKPFVRSKQWQTPMLIGSNKHHLTRALTKPESI